MNYEDYVKRRMSTVHYERLKTIACFTRNSVQRFENQAQDNKETWRPLVQRANKSKMPELNEIILKTKNNVHSKRRRKRSIQQSQADDNQTILF